MRRIYLNNAATSFPKPPEVINAVEKYLSGFPYNGRRGDADGNDLLLDCRSKVALFFGIHNPNDLIFTSGATESLNLAIKGLNLNGKHVVTTSIEHNSVIRPLKEWNFWECYATHRENTTSKCDQLKPPLFCRIYGGF